MRKPLLIMLLSFFSFAYSQNLVPNPSFEDTVACPNSYGQIDKANGWNSFGSSPEYFNTCSPWTVVHVPNNSFGFQYAATGDAYAGIITYDKRPPYSNYEFIGSALSQQLSIGQKYYVSFKINLPKKYSVGINNFDCVTYACNKIGVLFSSVPYIEINAAPINNFAHVYTDSIIVDTVNWFTVKGSFVADSSYNYIIIGNFFDVFSTDTIRIFQPNSPLCDDYAYYFLDDICVSLDSNTCNSSNGIINYLGNIPISVYYMSNEILITFNDIEIKQFSISLINIYGREIKDTKNIYDREIRINTNGLSSGLYILNFYSLKNSFNQKLYINN